MQEHSTPLTIACRFIPYDQWLVTHVDPTWKIKQVKSWILLKCITVPGSTSLPIDLPPIPRRPASPITFAQDPKYRPISPITFAPPEPVVPPLANRNAGTSDNGGRTDEDAVGYEEDDEWNADEDGNRIHGKQYNQRYRRHAPNNSSISSPIVQPNPNNTSYPNPFNVPPTAAENPSKHAPTYLPQSYIILRFSTGQIFEDDFTLAWYDLRPYELLEVHRAGVVLKLPRQVVAEYVAPYWEGWIKTLKVVSKDSGDSIVAREGFGKRDTGRTQSEWKDRWLVVRQGTLSLCKDLTDAPLRLLPLSSLTALRGAENLGETVSVTPGQRIICAKFKSRNYAPRFVGPATNDTNRQETPNSNPVVQTTTISTVITAGPSKPKSKSQTKPQERQTSAKPKQGPYIKHKSSGTSQAMTGRSASSINSIYTALNINVNTRSKSGLQLKSSTGSGGDKPRELKVEPLKVKKKTGQLTGIPQPKKRLDLTGDPKGKRKHLDSENRWVSGSDPEDSGSDVSAPVFAVSSGSASEDWFSTEMERLGDVDQGGSGLERGRYQYGSAHDSGDGGRFDRGGRVRGEESVGDDGDDEDWTRIGSENGGNVVDMRRDWETKEKDSEDESDPGETIILDMADENAYNSLLRVLHRYCPRPILSSFISRRNSTSPTPTPFPSPTVPSPDYSYMFWPPSQDQADEQHFPGPSEDRVSYEPSIERTRDSSPSSSESTLGSITPFEFQPPPSQHPPALASLSQSLSMYTKTLPFPEWREDIVIRAQKAGVGQLGSAMSWLLWNRCDECGRGGKTASYRRRGRDRWKQGVAARGSKTIVTQQYPNTKERSTNSHASSAEFVCDGEGPEFREHAKDSKCEDSSGTESDSEEESSESEWQGWMADLHRQGRVEAQRQELQQQRLAQATLEPLSLGSGSQDCDIRFRQPEGPQSNAQKIFQEGRRALEPSAVVTPMFVSPHTPSGSLSLTTPRQPTSSPFSTPSTSMSLSSPSSSESLSYHHRARALSTGFSPVDSTSSATSPSYSHTLSQSQSNSSLSNSYGKEPTSRPGQCHTSSSHSKVLQSESSGYGTPQRRPSMPILLPMQSLVSPSGSGTGPLSAPKSSVVRTSSTTGPSGSTRASSSLPLSRGLMPIGPGRFSPDLPSRAVSAGVSKSAVRGTPPPETFGYVPLGMPRRASSAGLVSVGAGGSLGRTSSIIARGSELLKKMDSYVAKDGERIRDIEQPREREREREGEKSQQQTPGEDRAGGKGKARGNEQPKGTDKEKGKAKVKGAGKPQRPKLSLATTASHRAVTQEGHSHTMLSGQLTRDDPASLSANMPLGKKTMGLVRGVSERLVRGLDPAMDFVEGR